MASLRNAMMTGPPSPPSRALRSPRRWSSSPTCAGAASDRASGARRVAAPSRTDRPTRTRRPPRSSESAQRLFPHRAHVARIDAHADLLVGRGASGSELDALARHVIHHRHALGHANGMVVGKDDDAESNPRRTRLVKRLSAPKRTSGHGDIEKLVRKWCSTDHSGRSPPDRPARPARWSLR